MTIYHRHHIIPRHMGGSDDPSNIIELTVEEHAEAHRILYEKYGRWQDKLAWQGLAGMVGDEEIIQMKCTMANKGRKLSDEHKRKLSESMKGKKHSEEHKRKISESLKGCKPWNTGKTGCITHSEETKRKISETKKKRAAERRAAKND